MASIFDMSPLEDGGGIARAGISYQDHAAVRLCLEMLTNTEMVAIWCETHDDLFVKHASPSADLAEFVQVKSDAHEQLWTISLLCQKEGNAKGGAREGTSPLERQLARDRGSEPSRYRFVTYRDVKAELALLKLPLSKRDEVKCNDLADLLRAKAGDIRSPSGHDLSYWVKHTLWETVESIDSLAHSNMSQLQEWCEATFKVMGSFSRFAKLHNELLSLVSELARAQGDPALTRRITRQELFDWLSGHVSGFPQNQDRSQAQEIGRLEGESLARCEELWMSLGVPKDEAWLLARDHEFGEIPEEVLQRGQENFTWFVAPYGTGKTLVMERLFQRLLSDLRDQPTSPIPVFIQAKTLTQSLQHEIELRAKKAGNNFDHLFLILDAVDECGTERASALLAEARHLSRTSDKVHVFVTSIPLPIPGFADDRIQLNPLSEDYALSLVSRFSGHKVSLWNFPEEIREASASPLFATLLGLSLRNSFREPHSIGELLDSLVKRALHPQTNEKLRPSLDHLMRLAILSTENEGRPVAVSSLSLSSFEIQPLIQSRLVHLEDNSIGFSVSLIRCWFAAEALRSGRRPLGDILPDARLFELWRTPLATYLSDCGFDDASKVFTFLAENHPSRASLLIHETFRGSNRQGEKCTTTASNLGQQLITAFESWRVGLGALSVGVLPCDSTGKLHSLKVFHHNSSLSAIWIEDQSPVPLEVREDSPEKFLSEHPTTGIQAWFRLGSGQPAWVWSFTKKHICEKLDQIVDKMVLPVDTGVIGNEKAWAAACERLGIGAHSPTEIKLSDLHDPRRRLWNLRRNQVALSSLLARSAEQGITIIRAPYPQMDREPQRKFDDFGFSPEQFTRRVEAVFKAALQAYRQLVEAWFPKFADRLHLYASHPVQIIGGVYGVTNERFAGTFCVGYKLIPHISSNESTVTFALSSPLELREMAARQAVVRNQTDEAPFFIGEYYSESVAHKYYHETPATCLAFEWLKHDLKSVEWLR